MTRKPVAEILGELKAKAEAATPGEWESSTDVWFNPNGADELWGACAHKYPADGYTNDLGRYPISKRADADAAHIAAFNPAAALRLIAAIERMERGLGEAIEMPEVHPRTVKSLRDCLADAEGILNGEN